MIRSNLSVRMAVGVAATALFLPLTAHAAITVVGNSAARACYENALQSAPTRNDLLDCDRAINDEALSLQDRAATFVNRGIIKMLNKDRLDALTDFDSAIAIDKNLGDAYLNRGVALVGLQRENDAIESLNKGLQLGSKRPEIAYYTRAIAYEYSGNVKAAYLDYRKAVELAPKWNLPQEQLARFQVTTKNN